VRTRKILIGVSAAAVVLLIALVSLKAYYVAIALVAGVLILGHRELWSRVAPRKLPPVDERIRENVGKATRNALIFFATASAFLMLFFSTNLLRTPDVVHVLGGLFVSVGLVSLLSYVFYDRAEPGLDERRMRMLRVFLLTAGVGLAVFVLSAVLHNAVSALLGVEEPVFFSIAVFLAPAAVATGLVGSLVIFVKGLRSRPG